MRSTSQRARADSAARPRLGCCPELAGSSRRLGWRRAFGVRLGSWLSCHRTRLAPWPAASAPGSVHRSGNREQDHGAVNHLERLLGSSSTLSALLIKARKRAPMAAPTTVPEPPEIDTPPTTTAAMIARDWPLADDGELPVLDPPHHARDSGQHPAQGKRQEHG